ncbi:S-layer homology domain-containing protein [Brevibacillus fulvus]
MKLAKTMLAALLATCGIVPVLLSEPTSVTAATSDYANHWAKKEIDWALQKGLIWKYADGTFRPDETVTQAQFLASLAKVMGLKEKAPYPAIGNHWARGVYEQVAKANWFSPDIKIDPNAQMTRYEAAAWITNAWGHKTYEPMKYTFTNHLLVSSWRFKNGLEGKKPGYFAYEEYNYFLKTALPTDRFTRAELAHTLKMIDTRKRYVAEAMGWTNQLKNSMYVKEGKVYGKVPNLPFIEYRRQAQVVYWDGDGTDFKRLEPGKNFALPATGTISIDVIMDSLSILTYCWELPSLNMINIREKSFSSISQARNTELLGNDGK